MIPQPTNIELNDWADQAVFSLDSYGAFMKLQDADWQRWAAQFSQNVALSAKLLPNPYAFENWTDWADRFCGALN